MRRLALIAAAVVAVTIPAPAPKADSPSVEPPALPPPICGPGSRPALGLDGRVVPGPGSATGYWCNMREIGHEGSSGGYKVERYVDPTGHVCAYYDTTVLFPANAGPATLDGHPTGTAALDMADPAHPVRTATLLTPAMQTPHESLLVNQRRGLLAAVMGNPLAYPGVIDIYDLRADCRHPRLESSLPVGLLGHESGWSPDGRTFYATSVATGQITAVDVSNPRLPRILWTGEYPSHGTTISDDGNRAYVAARGVGLIILDTSQIQARRPLPQVREVSRLTWPWISTPQVAIPVRIHDTPYLVEVDEFSKDPSSPAGVAASNGPVVGAVRIIDIANDQAPRVISNLRLAVNQAENRAAIAGDPGANSPIQGYAAHYCNVPREDDPGILACSFIASGLRVFDIRDPYHPKQIAYFVAPPAGSAGTGLGAKSDWAMSKPAFDTGRHEIWYADGNSGFYSLAVTNGAWPTGSAKGQ
jgi:hypothetical protein